MTHVPAAASEGAACAGVSPQHGAADEMGLERFDTGGNRPSQGNASGLREALPVPALQVPTPACHNRPPQ